MFFLFGFYINFNFFPLLKSVSPSRKRETVTGTHHDDRPYAQPLCFTSVVPSKVFYSPFIFLGLFFPSYYYFSPRDGLFDTFPARHFTRQTDKFITRLYSSLVFKTAAKVGLPVFLFLFRTTLKSNGTRNTGLFRSVECNDEMAKFFLPGKFDKTYSLVLKYNICH